MMAPEASTTFEPVSLSQPGDGLPKTSFIEFGLHCLRKPKHDMIVVFVHGILSSSEAAWGHPSWPELLAAEGELQDWGIFLFTYETRVSSRTYSIADVSDALREHFTLADLWSMGKIVFLCHSMGGIVVRRFLVANQVKLIASQPAIGLFLMASPSLGSRDANLISVLSFALGHTQAAALRFSQANTSLDELHRDFKTLLNSRRLTIRGRELTEDRAIRIKRWLGLRRQVVEPFSASAYFNEPGCEPFRVPGSDHSTIVKPRDRGAIQHLMLRHFLLHLERSAAASLPSSHQCASLPDRNPFFTGREHVFAQVHDALATHGRVALSGIGGSGKTQTAVEYAYRHLHEYGYVFWASAASFDSLLSGYATLAGLMKLPEAGGPDAAAAFKRWLRANQNWLLVLDNADDVKMASEFAPPGRIGHVLLTTQARAVGGFGRLIEIEQMGTEEGALFLLRRAKYVAEGATLESADIADRDTAKKIVAQLDGLPLALDQAAAYIEETGCGLLGYLTLYRTHGPQLLQLRGALSLDHPNPVAKTWALSFGNVERSNPAAAELLRCCAFLEPDDGIPEELFSKGAQDLGPVLGAAASDPLAWNDALSTILKYSLLRRDPATNTLDIHRLVQAVLKQGMDDATYHLWESRMLQALGYKVEPDSISPNGKYGVIYCSRPEIVRYEGSRMRNYLVSLAPLRIIGTVGWEAHFAGRNHSGLYVKWADSNLTALVTVDSKWGPGSVVLIEISGDRLVRQTNLSEQATAALEADALDCGCEPYNDYFLFRLVSQGDDRWSFDEPGRVHIVCTGENNPKQTTIRKSWVARLDAIWDIEQSSFIRTKVSRQFCGYYEQDQ